LTTPRVSTEAAPALESKPVVQIRAFLAQYLADGITAKSERAWECTVKKWKATMDRLNRFFGSERDISTITHDDAHKFRKSLDELNAMWWTFKRLQAAEESADDRKAVELLTGKLAKLLEAVESYCGSQAGEVAR